MTDNLETKDTLWTHEPPTEPGWYWVQMRAPSWHTNAGEWETGLPWFYSGRHPKAKDSAIRYSKQQLSMVPPSPANAPVQTPSEPKEEAQPPFFQILVDALHENKDRGPVVISREKLQRLIQGFIDFDKAHAADVEAAYREGFEHACFYMGRRSACEREEWYKDWEASDAKKKLEGR